MTSHLPQSEVFGFTKTTMQY